MNGRIAELKKDIARRVRLVMSAIPEDEFEKLIEKMAQIQFKYETMERDRSIRTLPDPDADDP